MAPFTERLTLEDYRLTPEKQGLPIALRPMVNICAPDSFVRRKLAANHPIVSDGNNYAQKLIHQARYSRTSKPVAGYYDPPWSVALNTSSYACPIWRMSASYPTRKVRFVRDENRRGVASFVKDQTECTVSNTIWKNNDEIIALWALPEGTKVVGGGGTTKLKLSKPALATGTVDVWITLPDSWYGGSAYPFQGYCNAVPIPRMADMPSWWVAKWGHCKLQATGSDGAAAFYEPSTGKYWEFWQFQGNEISGYTAVFGGYDANLVTNPGVMPHGSGTRAGGIPCAAGCIYQDEYSAGVIPHALSLALPVTAKNHLPPLTRNDSGALVPSGSFADAIPEGAMFRLPANVYINPSWSRFIKMVITAVRDYGLYIADTSGVVQFNAEDPRVLGTQFAAPYSNADKFPSFLSGVDTSELTTVFPWEKIQQIAYP